MKFLLVPAFLYTLLWFFLLVLYQLQLSHVLLPLNITTSIYLVGSIISFLVGFLLQLLFFRKNKFLTINKTIYANFLLSKKNQKKIKFTFLIAFIGVFVEIIYFRNLPFLSALGYGVEIRYTEFGFPGIHGLFNAIFLATTSIIFAKQLIKPDKKNIFILLLLCMWPILLMTRQLFISLFFQLLFIYLIIKRPNIKKNKLKIIAGFLLLIGIVLLFGVIGDLRSGRDSFLALAQPTFEYPDHLPTGFMWVYIYLTSPINNIINNIDITPNYFPLSTFIGIFPSFVRGFVSDIFEHSSQWVLVNETLNVSSIHQKIITDFGITLGLLFITFISTLIHLVYRKASNDFRYALALSVLLHSILLSFFVDFIFNLVFISQILIYLIVFKNEKKI